MDINKAFDSVWHKGLLYKLYKLGTPEYLIYTIKNLLLERRLEVRISDTLSYDFPPEQGIPQGSPLSPWLLHIYCYDIYSRDNFDKSAYILQYADDTALVVHAKTLPETLKKLQQLTDRTVKWFYKWRLQPNVAKTQLLMPFHRLTSESPTIEVDGHTTRIKDQIKYLGVTIDNKFNFRTHLRTMRAELIEHAKTLAKDREIRRKTAIKKCMAKCRRQEFVTILLGNASDKKRIHIQVTKKMALRLIRNKRRVKSSAYQLRSKKIDKTELFDKKKVTELQEKFKRKTCNWKILDALCLTRSDRHLGLTLKEFYDNL